MKARSNPLNTRITQTLPPNTTRLPISIPALPQSVPSVNLSNVLNPLPTVPTLPLNKSTIDLLSVISILVVSLSLVQTQWHVAPVPTHLPSPINSDINLLHTNNLFVTEFPPDLGTCLIAVFHNAVRIPLNRSDHSHRVTIRILHLDFRSVILMVLLSNRMTRIVLRVGRRTIAWSFLTPGMGI